MKVGTRICFLADRASVGLEIMQPEVEIGQGAFEHLTKARVVSGCELLANSLAGKN